MVFMICNLRGLDCGWSATPTRAMSDVQKSISTIPRAPSSEDHERDIGNNESSTKINRQGNEMLASRTTTYIQINNRLTLRINPPKRITIRDTISLLRPNRYASVRPWTINIHHHSHRAYASLRGKKARRILDNVREILIEIRE